ncbi:DUF2252 family protein [Pseudonocardia bannensis]|uniref:DUF2252 family protein n=1 Tax=Pseudonocardia bannensis TaxID=630973 RepID=UPI0028AFE254|nr:DUF2252 family protein [Pseudonocardia bannensis]
MGVRYARSTAARRPRGAHEAVQLARLRTRFGLLDTITETEGFDRILRDVPGLRRLDDGERAKAVDAFERYLDSIPESKRFRGVTYAVRDVAGRSGFGFAHTYAVQVRADHALFVEAFRGGGSRG